MESMKDIIKSYYEKYVKLKQKHFKDVSDDLNSYLTSEFIWLFKSKYRAYREYFINFDETLAILEKTFRFIYREVNFAWIVENIEKIRTERILQGNEPLYSLYNQILGLIDHAEGDYLIIKGKENCQAMWRYYLSPVCKYYPDAGQHIVRNEYDAKNQIMRVGKEVLSEIYLKKLIEKSRGEEE